MRFLIQRVNEARVETDGQVIGSISGGFLVLVGTKDGDDEEICRKMVKKLLGLRIFQDENDKTNLSLQQVDGELLIVSQFTLYADARKGNRPSFFKSGDPETAERLYRYIIRLCRESGFHTEEGSFGAYMQISLVNDGPFTLMLDSDELFPPR